MRTEPARPFLQAIACLLCLLPAAASHADAASGWSWLAPRPVPYPLRSVALLGNGHGFAVGDSGALVETRDGGHSWVARDGGVAREASYSRVRFVDAVHGYAVGGYPLGGVHAVGGFVSETFDAGATWQVTSEFPDVPVYDIAPLGKGKAIAVGIDFQTFAATVLRTGDGQDWVRTEPGYFAILGGVASPEPGTVVAVGYNGATSSALVLRSSDGGDTWVETPVASDQRLNSVVFAGAGRGVAVGNAGTIVLTADAGSTWTAAVSGSGLDFPDAVYRADGALFVAASDGGDSGEVLTSTDDGSSWEFHAFDRGVGAIAFDGEAHGVAVGAGGAVFETSDGGEHWADTTYSPSRHGLRGVSFADRRRGIAVGDSGAVLRTIDGGRHWTALPSGTAEWLYAVSMPEADFAIAVGGDADEGRAEIISTSDGGDTWGRFSSFEFPVTRLNAVKCAAGGVCVAVGHCGLILRSVDRGASWSESRAMDCLHQTALNGVDFADGAHGIAVGRRTLLFSDDGGATWVERIPPSDEVLLAVSFDDAGHVHVAGGQTEGQGTILVTVDGGMNWLVQRNDLPFPVTAIGFSGSEDGVATTLDGSVYGTADGGATWMPLEAVNANLFGVVQFDRGRSLAVGFSNGNAAVLGYDDHLMQDGFE